MQSENSLEVRHLKNNNKMSGALKFDTTNNTSVEMHHLPSKISHHGSCFEANVDMFFKKSIREDHTGLSDKRKPSVSSFAGN